MKLVDNTFKEDFMSIKIYDAFIVKNAHSLSDVMNIANKLKEKATKKLKENYIDFVVRRFFECHDLLTIYNEDELAEMLKKYADEESSPSYFLKYYKNAEGSIRSFYCYSSYLFEKVLDNLNKYTPICKGELLFIPCDDIILARYFGDSCYCPRHSKLLSDFHYQNQCDKPSHISTKEWEKRKKVWDNAIGPD